VYTIKNNNKPIILFCILVDASVRMSAYGGAYLHKAGIKKILDIESVRAFWPDNEIVNSIEKKGLLENTIVKATYHLMPISYFKAQQYNYSIHLLLSKIWPKGNKYQGSHESLHLNQSNKY